MPNSQPTLSSLLAPWRSAAFIGMCKNAGKTSAMARCIAEWAAAGEAPALTSIGRDGEDTDVVTGTAKPGIYVREGTLLATASGLLPLCDITREVLATTGIGTPMGEVVVLRALSDGAVQLAGPSTVSGLARVRDMLFSFGAPRVLIDGALSRKSLGAPGLSEASVLCTGASCGPDMHEVVRDTAYFVKLALLPALEEAAEARAALEATEARMVLLGREALPADAPNLARALEAHPENDTRCVLFAGALTDTLVAPWLAQARRGAPPQLAVRDASRILLSEKRYDQLARCGASLRVLEPLRLVAVTVNPFSAAGTPFEPAAFHAAMAEAVPLPVYDVFANSEDTPL